MMAARTISSATLFMAYILFAALPVQAMADPAEAWKVLKISEEKNNEVRNRGHMLFTSDAEHVGAAFRCEKGKLFAYLSTRPLDFEEILDNPFSNSKTREVNFSIGQNQEQTDNWVQMYRGHIYMVTGQDAIRSVFEQAWQGGEVTFKRRYKDPVRVLLPELTGSSVDQFMANCSLKSKYLPQLAG